MQQALETIEDVAQRCRALLEAAADALETAYLIMEKINKLCMA